MLCGALMLLMPSCFITLKVFWTHWGQVMHKCTSNLTIIGSDNGLSPGQRQAIIWTNAGILLTGPLRTNFNEILIVIQTFSFMKMHLKMSSGRWWPFCLSLYVLMLDVLNSFEEIWKYTCILYLFSTMRWHIQLKSFPMENKAIFRWVSARKM